MSAVTATSGVRPGDLRRGLALSPELRTGLAGTLALALVAMLGRVAVPVAVQQGIDRGHARRPAARTCGRGRGRGASPLAVLVVTTPAAT